MLSCSRRRKHRRPDSFIDGYFYRWLFDSGKGPLAPLRLKGRAQTAAQRPAVDDDIRMQHVIPCIENENSALKVLCGPVCRFRGVPGAID